MEKILVTVLLIDDHQVVRDGLRSSLERNGYSVIGEAASKKEAIAQIAHKDPQVIIVDLNLPDGSGLEVVSWARKVSDTIGIVVLTLNDGDEHLIASLQSGASAFVLKSAAITEVISAVAHAAATHLRFSAKGLQSALARREDGFGLTSRELEVLALLPKGQKSSQIATELFVSEATIKTHLASIYRKLSASNRTEAVVTAIKHGLIA
ncbi:MAG: response regulator transcription factor [Actinobacteria bacterium]|nr:response regulator transcription factor [Actinomycetota bacterium]